MLQIILTAFYFAVDMHLTCLIKIRHSV